MCGGRCRAQTLWTIFLVRMRHRWGVAMCVYVCVYVLQFAVWNWLSHDSLNCETAVYRTSICICIHPCGWNTNSITYGYYTSHVHRPIMERLSAHLMNPKQRSQLSRCYFRSACWLRKGVGGVCIRYFHIYSMINIETICSRAIYSRASITNPYKYIHIRTLTHYSVRTMFSYT